MISVSSVANLILKRIKDEIDRIALSSLVVAELDYGAKVSQRAKDNLEKLYQFVDVVQVVPFDIECAKIFGSIKSDGLVKSQN